MAESGRWWGWAVWFPECIEWRQPRQMIWAERQIHPPSEGKQKGHHGNLQCAGLAGLCAIIPNLGPGEAQHLGKCHGAGGPCSPCQSNFRAQSGCGPPWSPPQSLPETHSNTRIQEHEASRAPEEPSRPTTRGTAALIQDSMQ